MLAAQTKIKASHPYHGLFKEIQATIIGITIILERVSIFDMFNFIYLIFRLSLNY